VAAGFTLSKIVIVQSLEPHELKTGTTLFQYLQPLLAKSGLGITVELHDCGSVIDFQTFVAQLTYLAKSAKVIPLLHVECHGHPANGLEFENGSMLSWPEVSDCLSPLNIATKFNLFAVFSACFGAYYAQQMSAIHPSPCWGILAPTAKLDPGEILGGFRVFYYEFIKTLDAGLALVELRRQVHLSHGEWFGMPAEEWFKEVVLKYIRQHCTNQAVRARALDLRNRLNALGKSSTISKVKRQIVAANRSSIEEFFDQYFHTKQIPGNDARFSQARYELEQTLSAMRASGRFAL
jgi:hypothetical protein